MKYIFRKKVLFVSIIIVTGLLVVNASRAAGPEGYFKQGTMYLQEGRLELAIAAFTRAISTDPSYVEAYNNRALAYYEQGKLRQAEGDFLKALELDPHNRIASSNLGILYFEKGSYEKAVKYLENATGQQSATNPYDAAILRNLAFVYEKVGRKTQAEKYLEKALTIEENTRKHHSAEAKPYVSKPWQEKQDHVLVLKIWKQQ